MKSTDLPPDTSHIRTSELLLNLAKDDSSSDISFGEIIDSLGDRAFGPALLIFSLPMVLPMPPGVSTLFGLPQILITLQMLFGKDTLWFPKFVTERRFSRALYRSIVQKMAFFLRPVEHLLKPRFSFVMEGWFAKLNAFFMFLMGVIVFLPIPGFNMLPSLAILITAVGYIERDGLIVMLGTLTGAVTLGLIYGSLHLIIRAFEKLWHWLAVPLNWGD